MKKNIILATLAALFFLSISHPSMGQELPAIRKEIEKDNALYFRLFQNKDAAIVTLYTVDGILLPPNAPAVSGRAALLKDFKAAYADTKLKGVKFSTSNVYGDGKLYLCEEGTWQVFNTNGSIIDTGKYLKLWKKTPEGWRIFRDIFNSDRKS
ncbi:YybH family protein [Mucilaginibacter gilvus]|uniref:Nuclear transport factor 2 family protein n=1 Tax=Mucilaginibacter gilvus TaxID=2305909 RepID=A0A3S3YXB1_9SPHI|nr:nuclear transport factor 2 family protein [Mucilaginibacter gilvus]RWY48166.1 nuclear transport factor 2 family protein [Mucilaginibacter gilvus]